MRPLGEKKRTFSRDTMSGVLDSERVENSRSILQAGNGLGNHFL
jgi:hypothetical protein